MEEIKNDSQKKDVMPKGQNVKPNQYPPVSNKQKYIQNMPQSADKSAVMNESKLSVRIKKETWLFGLITVIALICFGMSVPDGYITTGEDAKKALKTQVSTTLGAGKILMSEDKKLEGKDMTITHNSKDVETKIHVWDYAAEDGDYVQILVDGKSLGDPFMIKNRPVTFTVPAVGKVQVKGTRDGGGGITYGIYYEVNGTSYFNGMNAGGDNVYTLKKETKKPKTKTTSKVKSKATSKTKTKVKSKGKTKKKGK